MAQLGSIPDTGCRTWASCSLSLSLTLTLPEQSVPTNPNDPPSYNVHRFLLGLLSVTVSHEVLSETPNAQRMNEANIAPDANQLISRHRRFIS